MTTAVAPRPVVLGVRGLGLLLAFDLLVLALLPHAGLALGMALGTLLFAVTVRRPVVALAIATHGDPLFWPLVLAGAGWIEALLPLIFVGVPLVVVALHGLWDAPRPSVDTRRLSRALRDPVFLLALALGLWLAFRTFGSPSPSYGRAKTIGYFMANLPFLLAALVFLGGAAGTGARAFDRFTRLLLVVVVALAAVGLWNQWSQYWPSENRLRALGLNPIWFARYLGAGLLVTIAARARLGPLRSAVLLVVLGLPFYLAGSRGPLLAFVFALAVWWTLVAPGRGRLVAAALLGVAGVAGAVAVELGHVLSASPLSGHDVSNLARAYFLKTVLDLGATPGFLGLGTGGFSDAAGVGDVRLYPHNLFLEVWTELGGVGVILVLAWIALVVRRARGGFERLQRDSLVDASSASAFSGPGDVVGRGVVARARHRELIPEARGRMAVVAGLAVFALANAQLSGDLGANALLWFWAGVLAVSSGDERHAASEGSGAPS